MRWLTSACAGGPFFNVLGMAKDEASKKKLRTNELRNGRLAMIAMLGYASQAVLTGKGPAQNLMDHFNAPFEHNLFTNLGH